MARISDLKSAHPGEWLAIEVTHEGNEGPEEGQLLVHTTDRREARRYIGRAKGVVYVTFAGPPLDDGAAAAF